MKKSIIFFQNERKMSDVLKSSVFENNRFVKKKLSRQNMIFIGCDLKIILDINKNWIECINLDEHGEKELKFIDKLTQSEYGRVYVHDYSNDIVGFEKDNNLIRI